MPTPSPGAYQSYRNLPPLAGLASMPQAVQPGLSVEECVRQLKRFHYCLKRLHGLLTARITAEPIYELKTAFSYHSYLCAEHVQALRQRVGEMREPPLGLEEVPHPALEVLFDEILCSPTTLELVIGVYDVVLPALEDALRKYAARTNPVADAPSRRVLRFALLELEEMEAFGKQALDCLATGEERASPQDWKSFLESLLFRAGGVSGVGETDDEGPPRRYSRQPYRFDPVPRRDERWQDLWNQGVNPEVFLYDPKYPAAAKALMMLFKRLREVDVPEVMAGIIHETEGKPWEYYRDMSRQLWDEARHAMLGEVGFVARGVDWTQARISHNWSMRLNTECTPLERHAVLYFIEQGLMKKTGKRYEWEVAVESGVPLMATIQDFDWADEVLHARIGRDWYVPLFADLQESLDYGDACWSRIMSNWRTVREQGLTRHENWWPALYRQACAAVEVKPDPKVLSFSETYEDQRADLRSVSGSA